MVSNVNTTLKENIYIHVPFFMLPDTYKLNCYYLYKLLKHNNNKTMFVGDDTYHHSHNIDYDPEPDCISDFPNVKFYCNDNLSVAIEYNDYNWINTYTYYDDKKEETWNF